MHTPESAAWGPGVKVAQDSEVHQSWLEHVHIGPGCKIIQCVLKGLPDQPIQLEAGVELIGCQVESTPEHKSFRWAHHEISSQPTVLQRGVRLSQSYILNSFIGEGTQGVRSHVIHSHIGARCTLRAHSNLTLTYSAPGCCLGSEISKSILNGEGFVSEHTASYLSLIAPSTYPILTRDDKEQLLTGLPNLTNIGAGTVFANYSGKPLAAPSLQESSGSQKGTGIVYGAFTAVNSVLINRYGQPAEDSDPFSWLRRSDLTILGLASFAEKKVTGRLPAFSYASQTSAQNIQIGWVLEKHPGILLNIFKKMQKQLGDRAPLLHDLIEGTLRLECRLLKEKLRAPAPFDQKQLEAGLATFQKHLDGRWAIDEEGQLRHPWSHDSSLGRWWPA